MEMENNEYLDVKTIAALRRQIAKKESKLQNVLEQRHDILRKKIEEAPACKLHCLRCVGLHPGFAHFETIAREEFLSWEGSVHGGITAMVIDTTMGAAVETIKKFDDRIATLECQIAYISPVQKNECICAKAWLSDEKSVVDGILKTKPNQKKSLHVECAVVAKSVCDWMSKDECQIANASEKRRLVARGSAWFVVFGKQKKAKK